MPMDLCEPLTRTQAGSPAASANLPAVGALVGGRYRLTRVIGAGGMGNVFEAEISSVGRRCAIKFLRSELAARSRSTSRFEREAQTLARLEHEHITAVFDYGWFEDETPFFVMEYLGGETLRRHLERRGPLAPALALELLQQACRGMALAHARGVVHRDLKPDNLMLVEHSDGRPWLKILDFGVARHLEAAAVQLTPTGAELGTVLYMSPEQARGVTNVDARADVYALGAIAYEALSGRRVHSGESYNEVLFHVITRDHAPLAQVLPACPKSLTDVIERCLMRDPADRPADGASLLALLERVEVSSGTAPVAAPHTAKRGWKRWAWPAAGLSLGAWVAILGPRGAGSGTEHVAATTAGLTSNALSLAPAPYLIETQTPETQTPEPPVASMESAPPVPQPPIVRARPPLRAPSRTPLRSPPAPARTAAPAAPRASALPFETTNPYTRFR